VWSVVRNASLAKGGTSKKRSSPHLHIVSIQSNKVSPWILQMALIQWWNFSLQYKWIWPNSCYGYRIGVWWNSL